MSKSGLELGDFTIASRTINKTEEPGAANPSPAEPDIESKDQASTSPHLVRGAKDTPGLERRTSAERERRAKEQAIAQEDARYDIRKLKRAKEREVKFFVNVALDQATKARLKRAADENDLKMASVLKAAIDAYLSANGY